MPSKKPSAAVLAHWRKTQTQWDDADFLSDTANAFVPNRLLVQEVDGNGLDFWVAKLGELLGAEPSPSLFDLADEDAGPG